MSVVPTGWKSGDPVIGTPEMLAPEGGDVTTLESLRAPVPAEPLPDWPIQRPCPPCPSDQSALVSALIGFLVMDIIIMGIILLSRRM